MISIEKFLKEQNLTELEQAAEKMGFEHLNNNLGREKDSVNDIKNLTNYVLANGYLSEIKDHFKKEIIAKYIVWTFINLEYHSENTRGGW